MAEIWASRKCSVCGKPITPGEKAFLEAEVKTTADQNYSNYRGGKSLLRVNFFANSDRSLRHKECPK